MNQLILSLQILLTFTKLSLISFGGIVSSLSELQHDVVNKYHWMSHSNFIQLYALAQMAPGPNVTVVTLIGWQVAGLLGAIAATIGMLLPASIVTYFVSRFASQFVGTENYKLLERSLIPIAIGLFIASGLSFAIISDRSVFTVIVTMLSMLFMGFTTINPVWIILSGAIVAFFANFFGIFMIS